MPNRPKPAAGAYSFITTEQSTLQAARGIINNELVARVNLYFTTLSSLVVALAFLAQLAQLRDVLFFFALVAFPSVLILGFTSFARIVQLASVDFVYIRAINRLRRYYIDHAPEINEYFLFPANDDELSAGKYGGYIFGGFASIQNFLSMGFLVIMVNTLVGAGLVAALAYNSRLSNLLVILLAVATFLIFGAVQLFVSRWIDAKHGYFEYKEVRFHETGKPKKKG